MNLVLKTCVLPFGKQAGIVCDDLAQRSHPRPLALGKILQNVIVNPVLIARVTDAKTHATVIVADMRADRAQPIMSGIAATGLDSQLGGGKIELVVEDDDVAQSEFIELCGFGDGTSRTRS